MWISWHYLDPIMHELDLLPIGTEIMSRSDKDSPIQDFSTSTNTLYAGICKDSYSIGIKTIKQFNQALLLERLGLPLEEIQQHIDLGTTDDT